MRIRSAILRIWQETAFDCHSEGRRLPEESAFSSHANEKQIPRFASE